MCASVLRFCILNDLRRIIYLFGANVSRGFHCVAESSFGIEINIKDDDVSYVVLAGRFEKKRKEVNRMRFELTTSSLSDGLRGNLIHSGDYNIALLL